MLAFPDKAPGPLSKLLPASLEKHKAYSTCQQRSAIACSSALSPFSKSRDWAGQTVMQGANQSPGKGL